MLTVVATVLAAQVPLQGSRGAKSYGSFVHDRKPRAALRALCFLPSGVG